jgi:hypothetical protein
MNGSCELGPLEVEYEKRALRSGDTHSEVLLVFLVAEDEIAVIDVSVR